VTPELVKLSKSMSKILRHAPQSVGLTLDPQGWVRLDELVAALRTTRARVEAAVAENDKQRFAVETDPDGVNWIRASQGHSARVGVDLGLPTATPPAELFHGTPRANLPAILAQGLVPGRRDHVHLSVDVPTALRVGRRRTSDVALLRIRAGELAATGHLFHRSANGVWLTRTVAPAYLDCVEDRTADRRDR
jgi:putative RNA 2'-phosphotransferase